MDIRNFPGGKSGQGVYQKLINMIPPHEVYIETHLGGGGIMRNKLPAIRNIGIEIDHKVIAIWPENEKNKIDIYNNDAVEFLQKYSFTGKEFVYCDPPYLRETREKKRKLYVCEYTRNQHIELLETIKQIPAMVMISGYESELYKTYLHDWNSYSFQAKTHKGMATEWIWTNYPPPTELHDYRYLGDNFRERERIKLTAESWKTRIRNMSVLERQYLLNILKTFINEE